MEWYWIQGYQDLMSSDFGSVGSFLTGLEASVDLLLSLGLSDGLDLRLFLLLFLFLLLALAFLLLYFGLFAANWEPCTYLPSGPVTLIAS